MCNGACVGCAELIAFPKHSCLNHVSRRLWATEDTNPFHTHQNQKRRQISPWDIVSFLPFMRNLAQDVALQRNRRWDDHKEMFSLRTGMCVSEETGKGRPQGEGMAQLSPQRTQRTCCRKCNKNSPGRKPERVLECILWFEPNVHLCCQFVENWTIYK